MLRITNQGLTKDSDRHWHVGDTVPNLQGRVVTFHADGYELQMLMRAMAGAYVEGSQVFIEAGEEGKV